MYRGTGAGKPRIVPARMPMALLLQAYSDASDNEAVELAACDARWQVCLDCLGEEPPFSQGALFDFRQRLIERGLDQRLLERTVEFARETGAFDWKKVPKKLRVVVDSSPLLGAGPCRRHGQSPRAGRREDRRARRRSSGASARARRRRNGHPFARRTEHQAQLGRRLDLAGCGRGRPQSLAEADRRDGALGPAHSCGRVAFPTASRPPRATRQAARAGPRARSEHARSLSDPPGHGPRSSDLGQRPRHATRPQEFHESLQRLQAPHRCGAGDRHCPRRRTAASQCEGERRLGSAPRGDSSVRAFVSASTISIAATYRAS